VHPHPGSARLVAALILLAAASAQAASFPSREAVGAALGRVDGDLVVFDQQRPGQPTRVLAAARVPVALERFLPILADPAAYRRALPSFRKAEIVARRGVEPSPDLLVAWELEVPLWNLRGKLWMHPVPGGVDLTLAEGDMSPGVLAVRVSPLGAGVLLTVDGHANVRDANWAARRLAARSPLAEPAMNAAAIWSLLRALGLEAQRTERPDPRRHPVTAMAAPPLSAVDGRALASMAGVLAPGLVVAAVRSRTDGRLDRIEVSTPVAGPVVERALAEAPRWRALPGWRRIDVAPARWKVDTHLPFVDLDATWALAPGPAFRAVAVEGGVRGAVMGWDVVGPVAVFSSHPRLEKSGYIARKFIEAEPILEQGLALGLSYVDALSLVRTLPQGAQ
jgi:hypothetical protein